MFDPVRDHTFRVAGGVRSGRGGQQRRRYGGIRRAKIQPVFFLECDMRPVSIDPYRGLDHVGRMSPRAFPSTIFFPFWIRASLEHRTIEMESIPHRSSIHPSVPARVSPAAAGRLSGARDTGPSLRLCFYFTSSFRAD